VAIAATLSTSSRQPARAAQPSERVRSEALQFTQWQVGGMAEFTGTRAYGLQQVRLAAAGGAGEPGRAALPAGGDRGQVRNRCGVAAGDVAVEHRAVRESHAEWQLQHGLSPPARARAELRT
jgi:hypothetical protein